MRSPPSGNEMSKKPKCPICGGKNGTWVEKRPLTRTFAIVWLDEKEEIPVNHALATDLDWEELFPNMGILIN